MRRLLLGLAGLLFVACSEGDQVRTMTLQPVPFARNITAEGMLEAEKATPISAPNDSPEALKVAWVADDGAKLKKDDLVVRFDPADFEDMLLTGREEDTNATNRIQKSSVEATATRSNLKRDAGMAARELKTAQQFRVSDEEIFSRYQQVESNLDEGLAIERKDYAEDVLGVRDSIARADREILGIESRKAGLKIRNAEQGLRSLEVRAPHDGLLVLRRGMGNDITRVGSTAWPGMKIGEIPDLAKMKAEVFVLEADAAGLTIGQKARVTVESRPDRVFTGKVTRIDKLARPRFRNVPVQYFGVTVTLDAMDAKTMKPGARVRAVLEVENTKSALVLPRQAIFEKDGKRIVYLRDGSKFKATTVETGTSSAGRVVITKGLKAGSVIALSDPELQETGS
jgi:multidrug resistance efflux pump